MEESGVPIKIRACDTLGYGVSYPGAALQEVFRNNLWTQTLCRFPERAYRMHGHNDFYKAVCNAATAWLYGASAVNCSLLA